MNKQQLAARIWASANEMRSKIEASEYKDYILGFIFYKFLSDREEQFLLKNGFDSESMETVREDDPETLSYVQNNLGYFISYDDLYSTWLA
ncbi:type I restriction-modification system subunit M N-terminal domain-containing protein [Tractidigestivibacter montrealensis]|uniref:Type I restriction-modification system subunit M N-terminal domain-containing protein n=1 Tax=Tractidigestivibacter montrealensis TaxID=2972466 RepID=A0ABT1ZB29_9ACTN|nr:type I restriction-modification system subunit M N-terminal domain-containing protein [Tractidigestivibacter montrealensis]MCR9037419.1 type I restriction-modification system subunit M N-terminal domain-containing protein [Tractidigestivibacter montrealensis]